MYQSVMESKSPDCSVDNCSPEAATIRKAEELLLSMNVRKNKVKFAALLCDDFKEFGASGRVFTKDSIINSLTTSDEQWNFQIEDFEIEFLSVAYANVTYKLSVFSIDGILLRQSLRSSLWHKSRSDWQMKFHQGTAINP